jgi:hypothetical protein
MDIFWFERTAGDIENLQEKSIELESNGFSGTMYPYGISSNDFFTQIPSIAKSDSEFKYIVAIRPHVISPQYLSMICNSLNKKYPDRIILNFVTGWIEEHESNFGGILSYPNDRSSRIDRSEYMIEYVKVFKNLKTTIPKFYISTTNKEKFEKRKLENFPMIIPYCRYKTEMLDLKNTEFMVSICPIFNKKESDSMDNEFFTKETFFTFLKECKEKNISGILIYEDSANPQYEPISEIVKLFKN